MNLLKLTPQELKQNLKQGKITVAVYGLGRVGLPLATAWLRAGAKVIGVDIREEWVKALNSKNFQLIDEPQLKPILIDYIKNGLFKATTDGVKASKQSNVKLITVPTLITPKGEADLSALKTALTAIAKGLKEGDLVIIESSVPPKTTEEIAKPILEEISGLKAEEQFGLAFSPERIMVGKALQDIEENYPKIIGGVGPKSAKAAAALYECIARKGVIILSSATAAELAKLFEGVYRDVNIALANELAKLCTALNIDYLEVRKASNSQPYCHLHLPGCGVGGACIPIYPQFIIQTATKHGIQLPLTSKARQINNQMPKYTVNLLQEALEKLGKQINGAKIAILGVAFRGNISDTRLSPAHEIAKLLKSQGATVTAHDPYVKEDPTLKQLGIPLAALEEAVNNADAIIIATDHKQFKNLNLKELVSKAKKPTIIIDGRNLYVNTKIPSKTIYISISGKKIFNP